MKIQQAQNPPDQGCFSCVKITLIVLYVLGLILFVILVALATFALIAINNQDVQDEIRKQNETTDADLELAKKVLIYSIAAMVVSTVFTIIGLVGVIKEHKITMIIITVICLLELIYYGATGAWFSVFIEAIMFGLTGGYVYMIIKREKYQGQSNMAI